VDDCASVTKVKKRCPISTEAEHIPPSTKDPPAECSQNKKEGERIRGKESEGKKALRCSRRERESRAGGCRRVRRWGLEVRREADNRALQPENTGGER